MVKVIEMFGEIKEFIINVYEFRIGFFRIKIFYFMDLEFWFNVKKVVEFGFVDKVFFEKEEIFEQDD